jgi:putative transposase
VPRAPRDTAAGLFHVTCHSVWAGTLFEDDLDRMELLLELASTVARFAWTCLSYCLMTNHLHLILDVGDGTLSEGMQLLNTRYACRFNQRHGLRGHVFAGRYGGKRIHDDAQLVATFAYDANNPVEAGACESPTEWEWSSYRGTVGLGELASFVDPARVLRYFGGNRDTAVRRLRAYVEGS